MIVCLAFFAFFSFFFGSSCFLTGGRGQAARNVRCCHHTRPVCTKKGAVVIQPIRWETKRPLSFLPAPSLLFPFSLTQRIPSPMFLVIYRFPCPLPHHRFCFFSFFCFACAQPATQKKGEGKGRRRHHKDETCITQQTPPSPLSLFTEPSVFTSSAAPHLNLRPMPKPTPTTYTILRHTHTHQHTSQPINDCYCCCCCCCCTRLA